MNAFSEPTSTFNVRQPFFCKIKNNNTVVQQNSSLKKQIVLLHGTATWVTYNRAIITSFY